MVEFGLASVGTVLEKCGDMFHRHAYGVGINNLKVNEEVYLSLEQCGVLDLFVAKDGNDIVGYMPIIRVGHHRQDNIALSVDCIFLMERYRGSNVAYRFIRFATEYYEKGLENAILSFPIQRTHTRLLEKLGFEEEAIMFRKFINKGENKACQMEE